MERWQLAAARQADLPPQAHPIIGRERDLAAARQQLVRAEVRLLTLTGPPGVGKTRLAIELGTSVVDEFADGVQFVDLSPLSDPRLVIEAITRQLGLGDVGREPSTEVVAGFSATSRCY